MAGGRRPESSGRSAKYRRWGPGGRGHLGSPRAARVRRRAQAQRSLTPPQWLLLAGLVPAVAVVAARRRLAVPPPITLALVSAVPVALAAATPRQRWRYAAVGAAYMWSFTVTWTLPYDDSEKLRGRLRVDYPIRIDRLIGLGAPVTLRLQRRLRHPPRVTPLDRAVTLAYASWFVPHLALAWLLLQHEEYVPRAAGRLAAAYHLTTPFYYLVPTAPPWWASEEARRMDGGVERVRREVLNSLSGSWRLGERGPEGNPWASMPSDHVASAAITAMGLQEIGPVYGALGWTYVALAAFSVVYLGEHYVIDVIVGLAIAGAIHRGEGIATPLVHRVVLELDRLAGRDERRARWLPAG